METTQQIIKNLNKARERQLISNIQDLPIVPKTFFREEENHKQLMIDCNLPIIKITPTEKSNLTKLLNEN